MRIAINEDPEVFFNIWASFCDERSIPYRRVNCAADNIIAQMEGCDSLLWWWDSKHKPFAIQLTKSLELTGKLVSPSFSDCWHVDDKIAQKYAFEALGLPAPRTHIFFEQQAALRWAASAGYPQVFKLRSSSLSENVWLARTPAQAKRLVRRAYGRGFALTRRAEAVSASIRRFRSRRTLRSFAGIIKRALYFCALLLPRARLDLSERGHAYFQDYITDVQYIYRVLVLGNRACASRQTVSAGEFRRPGVGVTEAGRPETIPRACMELAFTAAERLHADRLGLELVLADGKPVIIETDPFGPIWDTFPGFWDDSLKWHESPMCPAREIIETFTESREAALRLSPQKGACPPGTARIVHAN